MAHYAFLNSKNIVTEIIVGIDENELIEGLEPEIWYGHFRNQKCKRTSYNGKIRGKYAAIGDFYDEIKDIFVAPQPFPSWTQKGCFWEPPKPYPSDGAIYQWDDSILDWIQIGD